MCNIQIRKMTYDDIPLICKAENDEAESNVEYLKNHMENQENKKCSALIALYDDQIAGHVFLYYECKWGGLKNQGLPSVVEKLPVSRAKRRKKNLEEAFPLQTTFCHPRSNKNP